MTIRKDKPESVAFLLDCSPRELESFELAKLAAAANLRSRLHELLDELVDEMSQSALAHWFRTQDRQSLRRALADHEDPAAWAKAKLRQDEGRTVGDLVPQAALKPGASHLAASMRYAQRNNAEGRCAVCPQPLDRNSVRYCTAHLIAARLRMQAKNGKGALPGTADWLYGDGPFESGHGKQPGTLKALAENRQKQRKKAKGGGQ